MMLTIRCLRICHAVLCKHISRTAYKPHCIIVCLQAVLADTAGGLLFVTAEGSFRIQFPWTATAIAVNCVSAEPLAVVATGSPDGSGSEPWVHILTPHLQPKSLPCASTLLRLHRRHPSPWRNSH
jgi:hypothetical protein